MSSVQSSGWLERSGERGLGLLRDSRNVEYLSAWHAALNGLTKLPTCILVQRDIWMRFPEELCHDTTVAIYLARRATGPDIEVAITMRLVHPFTHSLNYERGKI